MTCHPTHSISVAVMYLGAQHALAPGTQLGRRESFQDRSELVAAYHFQIDERGRVQPERAENSVPAVLVQSQAGYLLNHRAEQHKPQVTVDGLLSRQGFEFFPLEL